MQYCDSLSEKSILRFSSFNIILTKNRNYDLKSINRTALIHMNKLLPLCERKILNQNSPDGSQLHPCHTDSQSSTGCDRREEATHSPASAASLQRNANTFPWTTWLEVNYPGMQLLHNPATHQVHYHLSSWINHNKFCVVLAVEPVLPSNLW